MADKCKSSLFLEATKTEEVTLTRERSGGSKNDQTINNFVNYYYLVQTGPWSKYNWKNAAKAG